jgi:hypothetical protein
MKPSQMQCKSSPAQLASNGRALGNEKKIVMSTRKKDYKKLATATTVDEYDGDSACGLLQGSLIFGLHRQNFGQLTPKMLTWAICLT